MLPFVAAMFLGAFLLFQIQPLIGKFILPWYGGTPGVWTTCLLFFQVMLLAGYCYAHLVVLRLKAAAQAVLHVSLLAATLLLLPITPDERWSVVVEDNPAWQILLVLTVSVGGPYLMLATTSPLLSSWFSRAHPGRSPYRLYALSNVGSLLALFSYPFVFEPMLTSTNQSVLWSRGYAIFVVLSAVCSFVFLRSKSPAKEIPASKPIKHVPLPSRADRTASAGPLGSWTVAAWLLLPMVGTVMLMAATNQICQDVAAVPLLWILPLGLYLLTFIICFDRQRWYVRSLWSPILFISVAGAMIVLTFGDRFSLPAQVATLSAAMFACCMTCHGELVRIKPAPQYLTLFYLMLAAGGAAGGVFVAIVAPLVFNGYTEFPLGLFVSCGVAIIGVRPEFFRGLLRRDNRRLVWLAAGIAGGSLAAIWLGSSSTGIGQAETTVAAERNFYGTLKVIRHNEEAAAHRGILLSHGNTVHGFQLTAAGERTRPTAYYVPESGIGLAITHHPRYLNGPEFKIGIVGLGGGTLASYAREGHAFRFYEINPAVIEFAEEYFTFLADARARGATVDVVPGDARISLERELNRGNPQRFDVLAVDAFSSDSIPVHLLTRECFDLYWRHLKDNAILAVHVSNRHLDLAPIVHRLCAERGSAAVLIDLQWERGERGATHETAPSQWVLAADCEAVLQREVIATSATPWAVDSLARVPLWTDEFSSLFSAMK